jgi:hypothetical protein
LDKVNLICQDQKVGEYDWSSTDFGFDSYDDNMTVQYIDKNSNNLLDCGDIFIVNGTEAENEYWLNFTDTNGDDLISIYWTPGYVYSRGHYPFVTFTNPIEFDNQTDTCNFTIRSIIGKNNAKTTDLYIYLYRNDEKVLELGGGRWLHYTYEEERGILEIIYNDTDLDDKISVGDVIVIKGCESGQTYKLELDYSKDYICAEIHWVAK